MRKLLFTLLFFHFFTTSFFAQDSVSVRLDTSKINSSFRGACIPNDKIGWVCGSKGIVGKTTDGGMQWNFMVVNGDDKGEFRDMEAWDENSAIILSVHNPARILKTGDGGKTWNTVYENNDPAVFLDGMSFWDRNKGIIYGDPVKGHFFILTTNDGGETWTEMPAGSAPSAVDGEAGFAASGSGIYTGSGGKVWFATGGTEANVYFSSNYGKSWQKYATPIMKGSASKGINSVDFRDDQNGMVMGGDFTAPDHSDGVVAFTDDGGKTWKKWSGKYPPNGYRSCVKFISKNQVLATGKNGTDYSDDGGQSWAHIDKKDFNIVIKSRKGKWILLAGAGKIGRLVN